MRKIVAVGGIDGQPTVLFLHSSDIDCAANENLPELKELGDGLTLLPHAVSMLDELGITETPDRAAVRYRGNRANTD